MSEQLKQIADEIFRRALDDCSIVRAFSHKVHLEGQLLKVNGAPAVSLQGVRRVRVLAAGKAAPAMLDGWFRSAKFGGCDVGGVLIALERPQDLPDGFAFFAGGHPHPNSASFAGARAALAMADDAARQPETTFCVFLISGGASSMMELPLDPAISLEDMAEFHRTLVASGASIAEVNCLRKHFSAIKGGRLAMAAAGARTLTLLVCDVPAGKEDALASGPTVADTTTSRECRDILQRHAIEQHFPPAVQKFFAGEIPETPKPGELTSPAFVLLSSSDLQEAARRRAEALGFEVMIDNTCDDWPYEKASDYLLGRARELRHKHGQLCLISCGEVSVRLPESLAAAACGGRNQQWALYTATRLGPEDAPVAALSAGSDGIDGNSTAAGAVIDETTADTTAHEALRTFNAYGFLHARHATLVTGPTGQNLRDIRIVLTSDRSLAPRGRNRR